MIRQAKAGDLENISRIENLSFDPPWSLKALSDTLEESLEGRGSVRVLVWDRGEGAQGYIIYSLICREAEVFSIASAPEIRGQGVGKALMDAMLAQADTAFLEVRQSNAPALALYLRCGFKPAGLRKKYYSDGEDAVVMTFKRKE